MILDIDLTSWEKVHDGLRRHARDRACSEYYEGRLLLAAEATKPNKELGLGSFYDYIDGLLGYDARTTLERLRVAKALEKLPKIALALESGQICWSVARELTRKVTPEVEDEWLGWVKGKRVRQVQRRIANLPVGAHPDDPADPQLRTHKVTLELSPEDYALLRGLLDSHKASRQMPEMLDNEAFSGLLHEGLGAGAEDGRPPFQMAVTICERCDRTWAESRGERIEVHPRVGAMARCDSEIISATPDGGAAKSRAIPVATEQFVKRRAGGRCEVPGCRSRYRLSLHHYKDLFSEGAGHDPDELVQLCWNHHDQCHDFLLVIRGDRKTGLLFEHADGSDYGDSPDVEEVKRQAKAFEMLRDLGHGETASKDALHRVRSLFGPLPTEERVSEALKLLDRDGFASSASEWIVPYHLRPRGREFGVSA